MARGVRQQFCGRAFSVFTPCWAWLSPHEGGVVQRSSQPNSLRHDLVEHNRQQMIVLKFEAVHSYQQQPGMQMVNGVVTIGAAIIAAAGAVIVAYASNFVAEQYRRHLDSTGWASAIAGELKSHAEAFPLLKQHFTDLLKCVENKKPLPLHPIPMPIDPVFDSAPGKVGIWARSSRARSHSHTRTCVRSAAHFSLL